MKNLILILVMLIPFSLFAQEKVEVSKTAANANTQTDIWMNKISSDSELRGQMMVMMIEKTKGSQEEMQKLVNSMKSDPGMNKLMMASNPPKPENKNNNLQMPMMMKDSSKVMKMSPAKTILREPKY